MCVQNKHFGFVFGTFLTPVWPYHLDIVRCKTTVNLLSYGGKPGETRETERNEEKRQT